MGRVGVFCELVCIKEFKYLKEIDRFLCRYKLLKLSYKDIKNFGIVII